MSAGFVNMELVTNAVGGGYGNHLISGPTEWQPGLLRPYIADEPNNPRRGRPCVTLNTGRYRFDEKLKREVPIYQEVLISDLQARGINTAVFNATTLRKYEWVQYDQAIVRAARLRMRAWEDLKSRSAMTVNGMSKTVLEYETMSDPGRAMVDMDVVTETNTDAPKYQLEGLPLPITHTSFRFGQRRLAISKSGPGESIDTSTGESAGRRIGEMIEKTLIGVETGISFGGTGRYGSGLTYSRTGSVYGYMNFTPRLTKTNLYKPTGVGRSGSGWVPNDTLKDVLAMRNSLYANKFYGPFMIYHSTDWDEYLDNDYILSGGNVATQTLRERLKSIEGVEDVRRLDFLVPSATTFANDPANITSANPWTMIMVQMDSSVVQAVTGLDITTVQWETSGGAEINFRVMAIAVPRIKADFYGYCGLLHANASAGV